MAGWGGTTLPQQRKQHVFFRLDGHESLNVWYEVTFQLVRQDLVLINFDKSFDMCLHIGAKSSGGDLVARSCQTV